MQVGITRVHEGSTGVGNAGAEHTETAVIASELICPVSLGFLPGGYDRVRYRLNKALEAPLEGDGHIRVWLNSGSFGGN